LGCSSGLQERKSLAATLKQKGNDTYQAKKYTVAAEYYTRAIAVSPQPEPVFYSNRAACYVSMEPPQHEKVLEDCDEALKLDSRYVKALNRRATALEALERYEDALRGTSVGHKTPPFPPKKTQKNPKCRIMIFCYLRLHRYHDSRKIPERCRGTLCRARAGKVVQNEGCGDSSREQSPREFSRLSRIDQFDRLASAVSLPTHLYPPISRHSDHVCLPHNPVSFLEAVFSNYATGPPPSLPENPTTGDNTLILALEALGASDYAHSFSLVNEAVDQGVSWELGRAEALNLRGTFKSVFLIFLYCTGTKNMIAGS
jgi:hypothetical protein